MQKHPLILAAITLCVSMNPVLGQTCAEEKRYEYVTIVVTGEAKGKPDLMVLELASEATAGNAVDALSQCRSKADEASDAIAALSIQGAEVIREMYEFSSPTAGISYGMSSASTPAGTKATQVIRIRVILGEATHSEALAETISRVLDAANKVGVGFRQAPAQPFPRARTSPVTYMLEDATDLRMKAIDDCVAKAAQIKTALAKSGVRPGKLVGVKYQQTNMTRMLNPWMTVEGGATSKSESATSTSPNEITVRTSLTLRFSVEE